MVLYRFFSAHLLLNEANFHLNSHRNRLMRTHLLEITIDISMEMESFHSILK